MIGSIQSGATNSLVAKNGTKNISAVWREGSNSEIKQITPKPITETYFDTNLSMFGWAGLPVVANMDFKC